MHVFQKHRERFVKSESEMTDPENLYIIAKIFQMIFCIYELATFNSVFESYLNKKTYGTWYILN